MLYKVGRTLQLLGMILLPVAMAGEVEGSMSLGRMLTWASVGVVLFMLGWMMTQGASKS